MRNIQKIEVRIGPIHITGTGVLAVIATTVITTLLIYGGMV